MSPEAWNVANLVRPCCSERVSSPLSRLSALALLVCCAVAILMVVRILRGAA